MRREVEAAFLLAKNLPLDDLPHFLGELESIRLIAFARLVAPASQAQPDSLLNVEQASARLACSQDFLYRNHKRLPFTRRIGSKLLFSSNGIDKYIERRAAK
jgi:predicted DNA-binding transcriptional regulator AlpA